jgi:hypothetical protein
VHHRLSRLDGVGVCLDTEENKQSQKDSVTASSTILRRTSQNSHKPGGINRHSNTNTASEDQAAADRDNNPFLSTSGSVTGPPGDTDGDGSGGGGGDDNASVSSRGSSRSNIMTPPPRLSSAR